MSVAGPANIAQAVSKYKGRHVDLILKSGRPLEGVVVEVSMDLIELVNATDPEDDVAPLAPDTKPATAELLYVVMTEVAAVAPVGTLRRRMF